MFTYSTAHTYHLRGRLEEVEEKEAAACCSLKLLVRDIIDGLFLNNYINKTSRDLTSGVITGSIIERERERDSLVTENQAIRA